MEFFFFFIPAGTSFADQHGKDFTKQFVPHKGGQESKKAGYLCEVA